MGLLQKGSQDIVVFPEVIVTDEDGNEMTRASTTGYPARAQIQPKTVGEQPGEGGGTFGRATAQVGDVTSIEYRMRIAGNPPPLGAAAQIEWQGKRYAIQGDAREYTNTPRTAHCDYVIYRR